MLEAEDLTAYPFSGKPMVHPNSLANLKPPWTSRDQPKSKRPPVTTALRQLFDEADEAGETNATKFAKYAMQRATMMRSDSVIWARLILERVDGLVKQQIEHEWSVSEKLAEFYNSVMKRDD